MKQPLVVASLPPRDVESLQRRPALFHALHRGDACGGVFVASETFDQRATVTDGGGSWGGVALGDESGELFQDVGRGAVDSFGGGHVEHGEGVWI